MTPHIFAFAPRDTSRHLAKPYDIERHTRKHLGSCLKGQLALVCERQARGSTGGGGEKT